MTRRAIARAALAAGAVLITALITALITDVEPARALDLPAAAEAPAEALGVDTAALPWLMSLTREVVLDASQRAAIGARLGVELEAASNQDFALAGGLMLRVNTLRVASEEQAVALVTEGALAGSPHVIARNGRTVHEIISPARGAALWARSLLDLPSAGWARYAVSAEVAPQQGETAPADYATATQLLWVFAAPPGASDADLTAQASPLAATLHLGATLGVSFPAGRQRTRQVSFTPSALTQAAAPDGTLWVTFDPATLPTRGGVPFAVVALEAEVSADPGPHLAPAAPPSLLASDPVYFPTQAPEVEAALADALATLPKGATAAQKLAALHRWTVTHIPHGGATPGARRPTLEVFASGGGRCFESADVLVTLCRAAGIPARPVIGWVVGLSGHVWVEAQVGDPDPTTQLATWQALDATTPWVGLDERYVALWHHDIVPIYLSIPTLASAPLAP